MPRRIPVHQPAIGDDELAAIGRVFDSRWLGHGDVTQAFEEALRALLDVPHVVAVSSGTAALHLALEALDLPAGSGVLVPSLTFVASVQAIVAARLRPVFCEVDPATLQLDLRDAGTRCAPGVRAVMPVHFGGGCCDMAALAALAGARGLRVVEDAAHAFGSAHRSRWLGTFGDAGCFSFDPIKNITCGEGGAIATCSPALAARVRSARVLGMSADGWSRHTGASAWAYEVRAHGWRYHMPNINAAIGLAQLRRLEDFRARKRAIVARYHDAFAGLDGLRAVTVPCEESLPFTYAVRVGAGRRDALMEHLRARGVGSAVEYVPNHLQPAFRAHRTPLPVTEHVFGELLSLPLAPTLDDDDVARVVDAVRSFFDGPEPT